MSADRPDRYDEWLRYMFGRTDETCDPFDLRWNFDAPPPLLADLVTHTFQNSGADLAAFTDRKVALGLEGILFSNFGDIAHVLTGADVSESRKLAILRSLAVLYRDCLARRSPPVLGHLSETADNRLEFVTYMLWDVTPFDVMAVQTQPRLEALIEVFTATLRLSNDACIESALHGLGHLGGPGRGKAQTVIDDWLNEGPQVRPELIAYARAARGGCIQ
jgi:hypothetical protein